MNTNTTTTVHDLFYLINCAVPRAHVNTSLETIAERLCSSSHNKVYLEDDDGKLQGLIQARDVALKILQYSHAESSFEDCVPLMVFQLNSMKSTELAIQAPVVQQYDTLKTALEVMGDRNVREIAVVDEEGRLIGALEGKTILAYYLNKKSQAMGQQGCTS